MPDRSYWLQWEVLRYVYVFWVDLEYKDLEKIVKKERRKDKVPLTNAATFEGSFLKNFTGKTNNKLDWSLQYDSLAAYKKDWLQQSQDFLN